MTFKFQSVAYLCIELKIDNVQLTIMVSPLATYFNIYRR